MKRFKQLRDVAREEGMILSSISTNLHWKYSLSDKNAEVRQKGVDVVRRQIEAATMIWCRRHLGRAGKGDRERSLRLGI